jgi:hypothetical protein
MCLLATHKKSVTSPVENSVVDVGLVTVDRNRGKILYGGETLVPAEAERMAVACHQLPYPKQ